MTITASELFAIVEGVPKSAWPDAELIDGRYWVHASYNDWRLMTNAAALMFEASIMRWLTMRFETVVYRCPEYDSYTVSQDVKEWSRPTLLEALAAACREIDNG